jgi:hypothetical protein
MKTCPLCKHAMLMHDYEGRCRSTQGKREAQCMCGATPPNPLFDPRKP